MRYVIDSREVAPGDCFCALKGARVDGHNYIEEAKARGAGSAIVERKVGDLPQHVVPNVLEAIQEMAKEKVRGKRVYALSGAMGKTTTKCFLSQLLPGAFPMTVANHNTQISMPLTVLNELGTSSEIFLEMGMTHTGDLKRLVEIAPPTIAMLTYIPQKIEDYIHAYALDSIEELVRAKGEIFESDKLELALLPDDLPCKLDIRTPIKWFSLSNREVDYFAEIKGDDVLYFEKGKCLLTLPRAFPKHHLRNFLAAVVFGRQLGLELEAIEKKAPFLEMPPMRFELREAGGVSLISDAYSASPEAMLAAFEALPKSGRRIGVLGEMLWLGKHADRGHKKVIEAAERVFDYVYCFGENWKNQKGDFTLFENREDMVKEVIDQARPGDLFYFKGSRNLELENEVEAVLGALND